MKFSRGHVTQEMTVVGSTDRHGTIVTFKPDPEMFEDTVYDYDILHTRMREEAFLNGGVHIRTADERQGQEQAERDALCRRHPGVCHLHQPEQDPPARRRYLYRRTEG